MFAASAIGFFGRNLADNRITIGGDWFGDFQYFPYK
jgi:hypothetical protein